MVIKQYKLIIAYDGTDFSGWAPQPDSASVSQKLEQVFFRMFHKKITVLGASRTDAGVHALGQVAIFKADIDVDAEKMRTVWNAGLPLSITIRSLLHDDSFNPYFNVVNKTYYYHVFADRPLPFIARYGMYYYFEFDPEELRKALNLFLGTHDFHAFYTGTDRGEKTIRTIDAIGLEYLSRYKVYRITVTGERFLRHMVRRMVGAALSVAAGRSCASDIERALQTRTMISSLPTAPAQGLLLYNIIYKENHD